MRGRKALFAVAALAILLWPLLAAPPSEPLAAPLHSGGITTRVSVASDGTQGNDSSEVCVISADGRYVAFYSFASNLVPDDTNGKSDVFVHDRQTGTTERVSVNSAGQQGNNDSGRWSMAISADGRYVAFVSFASNLVSDDTNERQDIFVHDRQTGLTTRVSVSSYGAQANGGSIRPSISADGRYVAFDSDATNLVPSDINGTARDIFVHDRQTGATELVNLSSTGQQASDGGSAEAAISSDGRYVAFGSAASNLVPGDTYGTYDVFVRDRQTQETEMVSVNSAGQQGNDTSSRPRISAEGRYIAFPSKADNLVPGDTNSRRDAFVHDRQTGVTELVSVSSTGHQADRAIYGPVTISADGRYVAFMSQAFNLVPDDTCCYDVFVRDRLTGTTERVSVNSAGEQGNSASGFFGQDISADGRYVAFDSLASNLVPGDTNGVYDVFVHDRGPGSGPFLRRPFLPAEQPRRCRRGKPLWKCLNAFFDHKFPNLRKNGVFRPYWGERITANDCDVRDRDKRLHCYDGHNGSDFGLKWDTRVLAAYRGKARYKKTKCGGHTIIIKHPNGYQTRYLHLRWKGLIVNDPEKTVKVSTGQRIGRVGKSGSCATGKHLHLGVYYDFDGDGRFRSKEVVDPFGWMGSRSDPWVARKGGPPSYCLWVEGCSSPR